MTLVLLVFLGGVLSVLSPCILPVIPFVFARSDQPFWRSGLPLLAGMALTFAIVASLAAVAGGWAVTASVYGRMAAIAVLALFALALLSDRFATLLARPLVIWGDRLLALPARQRFGWLSSLLLGIATGLLWAPCAGPILGLVLTTAALRGATVGTSLLLLAYGLGAATALAIVLGAGMGVLAVLKRHLGLGLWVRRGLGVAVLAGVAAVATGADQVLLDRVTVASTAPIEQWLLDRVGPAPIKAAAKPDAADESETAAPWRPLILPAAFAASDQAAPVIEPVAARSSGLPVEGQLPGFGGAIAWLNSPPLSPAALRGKVVLVEFWTYGCINCRHVLPHTKAWAEKYRDAGLVVIGVHTPELAFEKVTSNVKDAVRSYGITYPVAIDLNYKIWGAFDNQYWPANYFADAQGRIRYHHFGEEDYANQERVIQQLLTEAGATNVPGGLVSAN